MSRDIALQLEAVGFQVQRFWVSCTRTRFCRAHCAGSGAVLDVERTGSAHCALPGLPEMAKFNVGRKSLRALKTRFTLLAED